MSFLEDAIKANKEKYRQIIFDSMTKEGEMGMGSEFGFCIDVAAERKREKPAIVSYRGFTGELKKLEMTHYGDCRYALTICDSEKKVKHSFDGVKFSDIRFLCGVVSFGE